MRFQDDGIRVLIVWIGIFFFWGEGEVACMWRMRELLAGLAEGRGIDTFFDRVCVLGIWVLV